MIYDSKTFSLKMSLCSSAVIAKYKTVIWLSPCVAHSLTEPSGKATAKQSGVDGMAENIG